MLVKNQDPSLLSSSGIMTERTFLTEKKKLKGKNISIMESLTATRMKKLKKFREVHSFKNVWTSDGKILCKDGSGNINLFYD